MDAQIPERVDLRKYVETRLFGERPHIRGQRVPVALIVGMARANGWSITETAGNFTLSDAEVLAALLYYEEHHEAIDAQEAEEARLFYAASHP